MGKRRFSFVTILLLCGITAIQAQWEVPISHYWEIKGYYNPSFAGDGGQIDATALYLYPATEVVGTPHRAVITVDMPVEFLKGRHGLGLVAYSESSSSLRNTLLAAQYSLKKKMGSGFFNIGVQAGMYNLTYDAGTLTIKADTLQNGPGWIQVDKTKKQVVDLGAGISWAGEAFYAGLSLMHLNQPGFRVEPAVGDSEEYNSAGLLVSDSLHSRIPRTYNFIAKYNIALLSSLEVQPMLWLQYDDYQTVMQATARFEYSNKYSGGISWFSDKRYSIFVGAAIEGFRLGYAYSAYKDGNGMEGNESHELFIKYALPLNSFKPKMQPHKNIRLL